MHTNTCLHTHIPTYHLHTHTCTRLPTPPTHTHTCTPHTYTYIYTFTHTFPAIYMYTPYTHICAPHVYKYMYMSPSLPLTLPCFCATMLPYPFFKSCPTPHMHIQLHMLTPAHTFTLSTFTHIIILNHTVLLQILIQVHCTITNACTPHRHTFFYLWSILLTPRCPLNTQFLLPAPHTHMPTYSNTCTFHTNTSPTLSHTPCLTMPFTHPLPITWPYSQNIHTFIHA